MNFFAAPNCHLGKMIFNETELADKRATFIIQLHKTREISVLTYNNLLSLSENPFLRGEVFVNDMPLAMAISFLERTVYGFTSSLYEEMASVSNDIIWLKGFTDYLLQCTENIKKINQHIREYYTSLSL